MLILDDIRKKTNQLINPSMKQYGVSTFGYRKFFPDGKTYGFSTNETFDNKYIPLLNKNFHFYSKEVKKCAEQDFLVFTRTGKPEKENWVLWNLYSEFNKWNTLIVYKKSTMGYIEGFYFPSDKNDKGFIENHKALLPLVNNHILEFKKNILISSLDEQIPPTYRSNISYKENIDLKKRKITVLEFKSIYLNLSDGQICKFPLKEAQCLINFILGRSCKEIGIEMGISHRTVETNLQRAYSKFNTVNKMKISRCLLKDPINLEIVNMLYL